MKYLQIILFLSLLFFMACQSVNQKENAELKKDDTSHVLKPSDTTLFDIMGDLSSHMKDKVKLDTFMTGITNQKAVRVITQLKEDWNDTTKILSYSSDNYYFELKIENQATTFKDGSTKIKFNDCSLICMPDSLFKCEDYGFKLDNSLVEPKILEVGGLRFLYSDVSYWCNGIGCGCFITFIYDLQNKKAIFLENYRIPFDGFYISDFDNDNTPDLLVISQTDGREMKGFKFEEFDIKLSWYYYDNGKFNPKFDKSFRRPYCYELYSFVSDYHHSYHGDLVYSITRNNWLK